MGAGSVPDRDWKELRGRLSTVNMKEKYERVQSLVRTKDTDKYLDASELRKELVSDIRENEAIILEIERKLRQIKSNRAKFPHVSDVELERRRKDIDKQKTEIQAIKDGIMSKANNAKGKQTHNDAMDTTSRVIDENERFITNQQFEQRIEIQNQMLGKLEEGLDKVQVIGLAINEELVYQHKSLTELQGATEIARNKQVGVMTKLDKMIKK